MPWLLRSALIVIIIILLQLPLAATQSLVRERAQRSAEVAAEVAASTSAAQRLLGPVLVLSLDRPVEVSEDRPEAERTRHERRLLLPESNRLVHRLAAERRGRSLFRTVLYRDQLSIDTVFRIPELPAGARLRGACVALGLGDLRGLDRVLVEAGGQPLPPLAGRCVNWLPEALSLDLGSGQLPPIVELRAELSLIGTVALDWVALAEDTELTLEADWPHPGFRGSALPREHDIRDDGFSARWRVSGLSGGARQAALSCPVADDHCWGLDRHAFGVAFVEPVDGYRMNERAIKYAVLQLVLVYTALFLLEVLGRLPVHPIQYGFAGAALAIFFLLLLALSEHIGFDLAWLVAALACTGLLGIYLAAVLQRPARGWAAGLILALVYGLLYGLLRSEDHALLLGTLLLFALLALAMLSTRHVDWSGVGTGALRPSTPRANEPAEPRPTQGRSAGTA